jgi:L-arabinose isomerase
MQTNVQLMHLITIPRKLELLLDMHGVILHLHTCSPMMEEIERYQNGLLQAVELTKDIPWELYSMKFAETEAAACAACSVTAL